MDAAHGNCATGKLAACVCKELGKGGNLSRQLSDVLLQLNGPNQQATPHARRMYIGGLPPSARAENIGTFFSNAPAAVGATVGPGPCVVNV